MKANADSSDTDYDAPSTWKRSVGDSLSNFRHSRLSFSGQLGRRIVLRSVTLSASQSCVRPPAAGGRRSVAKFSRSWWLTAVLLTLFSGTTLAVSSSMTSLDVVDVATVTNNSSNNSGPLVKPKIRHIYYQNLCPRGCSSCSTVNGCVTCRPRHFLHFQRTQLHQKGVCVASCPIGHLGVRTKHYSYCAKCRVPHCEVCLTKHHCTRCQGSLYEYRGQCVESCPEGLVSKNSSRECLPKVDCVLSDWGQWGVCAKNGRSCGAKYGIQTRVRQIVQFRSATGMKCPENTENRKCLIEHPVCPAEVLLSEIQISKKHKHRIRKRKNRRRKRVKKRRKDLDKRRKQKQQFRERKRLNGWRTTEISNQLEALLP